MMEYGFEELQVRGLGIGVLFSGTAFIEANGDGDFYIASIRLDGGTWLRNVREGQTVEAHLYRLITAVLYDEMTVDGRHLASQWQDKREDRRAGDPDRAYDERRAAFLTAAE